MYYSSESSEREIIFKKAPRREIHLLIKNDEIVFVRTAVPIMQYYQHIAFVVLSVTRQ